MRPYDPTEIAAVPLIQRWPLLHPVTWLFAALPFQWMPGPAGISLPYLFLMLSILALFLSPRAIVGAVSVVSNSTLWLIPYVVYLMILFIALHESGEKGMATRQIFFLAAFVTVAAWLVASKEPARLIRWWGATSIFSFLFVSEWIARGIGLSWTEAYSQFYLNGDLNFVMYSFLREVFDTAAASPEGGIPASQKNMVSAMLFIALILFRAGHQRSGRDTFGVVVTILVLSVLIMLNSRTVLVSCLLGFALIWAIRLIGQRQFSLGGALLRGFIVLFAVSVLLVMLNSGKPIFETLSDRFAFDDGSTGARMNQFTWALLRIEEAFFTGSGYAELNGQPVHNIFLSAFMHAGVFAFLLVLAFYVVMVGMWLGFVHRLIREPDHWVLPLRAEWLAVLPLQPLVRMWFSGDAGHHSVVEWTAMGVFAGLIVANSALRATSQEAKPTPASASIARPYGAVNAPGRVLYPSSFQ